MKLQKSRNFKKLETSKIKKFKKSRNFKKLETSKIQKFLKSHNPPNNFKKPNGPKIMQNHMTRKPRNF